MSRRLEQVNGLLRQEISRLVAQELSDPRLPLLVTITRVATSADLRSARVYVSIMGSGEEKRTAVATLQSAAGFLQRTLRPRLTLRYVPTLSFRLDESIEEGARMLRAIEELSSTKENT